MFQQISQASSSEQIMEESSSFSYFRILKGDLIQWLFWTAITHLLLRVSMWRIHRWDGPNRITWAINSESSATGPQANSWPERSQQTLEAISSRAPRTAPFLSPTWILERFRRSCPPLPWRGMIARRDALTNLWKIGNIITRSSADRVSASALRLGGTSISFGRSLWRCSITVLTAEYRESSRFKFCSRIN